MRSTELTAGDPGEGKRAGAADHATPSDAEEAITADTGSNCNGRSGMDPASGTLLVSGECIWQQVSSAPIIAGLQSGMAWQQACGCAGNMHANAGDAAQKTATTSIKIAPARLTRTV
jgi:hypothetical protein